MRNMDRDGRTKCFQYTPTQNILVFGGINMDKI